MSCVPKPDDESRGHSSQGAPALRLPWRSMNLDLSYSTPSEDGIWLWVYYKKTPIYPIFYLLKGDYRVRSLGVWGLGFRALGLAGFRA